MSLTDKYADKVISAMFRDWSFDAEITDKEYCDILEFRIGKSSEQTIMLRKNKGLIDVYLFWAGIEDYAYIGTYNPIEDSFEKGERFFELLFAQHLIF